jgi:O-glycosyl hydrolase
MTFLYRCRDGATDYGFSITRIPDGRCRAYITQQPLYDERNSDLAATHRRQDGHGIYVSSASPWTPEAARDPPPRC